jgi:hypothetical protein
LNVKFNERAATVVVDCTLKYHWWKHLNIYMYPVGGLNVFVFSGRVFK